MATYSYDPLKISVKGVDRMRFELGDTAVETGALTCPLCDEEYTVMIAQNEDWRRAKIACLKAIVMKLSYEVDTNVTGLSYALSQRYDRWKAMLDEEEKKLRAANSAPIFNAGSVSPKNRTPYFYNDLHANLRRF